MNMDLNLEGIIVERTKENYVQNVFDNWQIKEIIKYFIFS